MPKTCILICTFNRPELLRRLLTALVPQARKHGCMTVIIYNGTRSSEAVSSSFRPGMEITYERLAEPGIVSARNRAMRLALATRPEFLAFIDDDEVPEADWLANLLQRIEETGADFANGPVVPEYGAPPPRWQPRENTSTLPATLSEPPTSFCGPQFYRRRRATGSTLRSISLAARTMSFLAAWRQMALSMWWRKRLL